MGTRDNRKPYLVELTNKYGRYFQQVQYLTEKESIITRLKGYNVCEAEKLNETYVRKLK